MGARSGFTLTEVLIATAILSGALAGAAMLLTSAFGTYRHQNQSIEVFHVVHDQMEMLTATPYSELKSQIGSARRRQDPVREGAGARDFVSEAAGDATARFKLVPEGGDSTAYRIFPRRTDVMGEEGNHMDPPGTLHGTLRLQYWDPTFDAPSLTDRGLIRASFNVKGGGLHDQAVKYLAR